MGKKIFFIAVSVYRVSVSTICEYLCELLANLIHIPTLQAYHTQIIYLLADLISQIKQNSIYM